jgi:ABC-type transport system substrate-binding protein
VNHPHSTDADVLASVDKVNTTPDGDARLQVLADAQELYAEQIPDFPLWYPKVSDAFTKKLQGYSAPVDAYQLDITDAYFSE